MLRRLAFAFLPALAVSLLLWQGAQGQGIAKTWILINAATAASTGTVAHVAGFTVATVQIVVPAGSSPSATVVFQQSLNNIHFTAVRCLPSDGTAAHTSVTFTPANVSTQPLLWRCNITGDYWFRTQLQYFSGPGSVSIFGIMTSGDPQVSSTGALDSSNLPIQVVVQHVASVTHVSAAIVARDTRTTLTNVQASAANQTLLAANAARVTFMVYNHSASSSNLYMKYGATASLTSWSVILTANAYYECPLPCYTGQVDGIWTDTLTAFAHISEVSR